DLFCIDDDHKVSTGEMWREGWFMFAAQDLSDLRCQAAEHLPLGIYDIPSGLQIGGPGAICLRHFQLLHVHCSDNPLWLPRDNHKGLSLPEHSLQQGSPNFSG